MEKRKRRRSDRAGRPAMRSPGRPRGAGRAEPQRFWKAIARGLSSEEAAVSCGVSPPGGWSLVSVRAVGCRRSAWRRRRLVTCPLRSGKRSQSYARRAPGCATWPVGFVEAPSTVSRERCRNAATRRGGLAYRASTAPWHSPRRAKRPKESQAGHDRSPAALRAGPPRRHGQG